MKQYFLLLINNRNIIKNNNYKLTRNNEKFYDTKIFFIRVN